MLSRVLVCVSIMFIGSDGSPEHLDTLLEKYKACGYFQGPVIQSVRLSVMFQCYKLCGYFPQCTSISYNPGRRQCHLHNTTGTVVPDHNWVHIKTILPIGKKSCCSSSCPGKLCIPLSARDHFCVAAMLEGNTSRDNTEKNTAEGTSSTHHVDEYPETTLNAALKIETSLSDTLTLQMDNGQYLTESSDISDTESMTPTMTLTYNQVDKLEHMVTSSFEIKATSSSALTLTYQLMDMTETAATTMNTGASVMGTNADTQVTTISDHTSAEDSVVTALSLVVLNTDLVDGAASVAKVTETTHSLPDESTTTLSPKMLKRKLFLKLHYRFLTDCINTFVMPFEETSTCTDKRKVQRNGKACSCMTGFHFNPPTKACVTSCTTYGRNMLYQSRLFCISGHNDRIINVKGSARACATACLKETTFVCRSFEIFMGLCYLSRDTRVTVNTIYWIPYCGCKYYQRTCAI